MTDVHGGDTAETSLTNGYTVEPQCEQNGKDPIVKGKVSLNRSASSASILQGNGLNKIKNLTRRVSFPSDDKLISGYNEPKNPWEHAHETTTEDLIQAYTQSCQSWNVKPITKLLLQLQEIKDFTVRANSLTLKGEKLETRVVETLESIFKRVQFITIDLEATSLDEDAAASLFDMIEYYESAVNVLVGFNKNLGNRGWQAAAHMMRKMSCLRLFDGHSVPLSMQAAPFVGRALRLSNTLVTLHLENAMLSTRPLLLIVAALKMNTTLRELFLADNQLGAMDALQIANLLKFNRILQLLDLRNNPIQDIGIGHLSAGLMAQSNTAGLNGPIGGLQTLVLWNNQISQEGMIKLAMALRHTVSLATLNLGQNPLGDDGMLRLKEGLLQNHSLLRLGLVGTKLTDEGAVAVAEYLAESPRIIRLDLRNNDVKVAGLMALSLAFKINNSLLRLDIDKPNKKDSLKELALKQESLMADMVSYAARNKEAALARVQATAARQEEARKSSEKEQAELRYMDMTNSSTPKHIDQSGPTCSNNSNNQAAANEPTQGAAKNSTVSKDVDDTPEDSPEFLPRSSVPYHQVAPVMLSNCEIAKRAAAARMHPVQEGKPVTSRFQIKPVSSSESKSQPQNPSPHSESTAADTQESGDHKEADESDNVANTQTPETVGDATTAKKSQHASESSGADTTSNSTVSSLQVKSASSFYSSKVKDANLESKERRQNLEILTDRLTNAILQNEVTKPPNLDATSVQSRKIESRNANRRFDENQVQPSDNESGRSEVDPATVAIQNLVVLATEPVPSDCNSSGGIVNSDHCDGHEVESLVGLAMDAQTSNENASNHISPIQSPASCGGETLLKTGGSPEHSEHDDSSSASNDISPNSSQDNSRGLEENSMQNTVVLVGNQDSASDSAASVCESHKIKESEEMENLTSHTSHEPFSCFNEQQSVSPNSDSTQAESITQPSHPSESPISSIDKSSPDPSSYAETGDQNSQEIFVESENHSTNHLEEVAHSATALSESTESNMQLETDRPSEQESLENASVADLMMNTEVEGDSTDESVIQQNRFTDPASNPDDVSASADSNAIVTSPESLNDATPGEGKTRPLGGATELASAPNSEDGNNTTAAYNALVPHNQKIAPNETTNANNVDDPHSSICESGFDTTAEDNSLLSGELSPLGDHQTLTISPHENADLLTPDSGVVNFIGKDGGTDDRIYHRDDVTDNADIKNSKSSPKVENTKFDFKDDHLSVENQEIEIGQSNDAALISNISHVNDVDTAQLDLDKFRSGD